ncbi:RNA-directed DNA polymerase, eukaryota, reverse transcriptase zinc-binding domain protein [Tanacetum coccineum]
MGIPVPDGDGISILIPIGYEAGVGDCKIELGMETGRSFFWGGSMDENTVSWIAWDKVLSPRNHGGLGIGIGQQTSFWHDTWAGGSTLHILFPRLHKLDVNPNCYVSERCLVSNVSAPISHLIDIGSANPNSPPGLLFNWAWRREPRTFPGGAYQSNESGLATRSNLDRRGIDHDSVWCPLCDDDIEMKEHLFIHCKVVKEIWLDVLKWWRIPNVSVVTLLDLVMSDAIHL